MSERRVPDMRVVVAGDVTMDWNLARVRASTRSPSTPSRATTTNVSLEPGGAALLARLISGVAAELSETQGLAVELVRPAMLPEIVTPTDEGLHHSYALWSRVGGEDGPWRVERFLGFDHAVPEAVQPASDRMSHDPDDADIVILDDAGLGFRDHPELWPRALETGTPTILLKMGSPAAQGLLWERLQELAGRVTAVLRIDDLRLTEVNISRELSWERTAQDLMWELLYNPLVNDLARCADVVVSFSTAGAFLLSGGSNGQDPPTCVLLFDPGVMEGTWTEQHPGGMLGYTASLTAAIARQLLLSPEEPNIRSGIQRGIAAMRALHVGGYADTGSNPERPRLAFPIDRMVEEFAKGEAPLSEVPIRDPSASISGVAAARTPEPRDWMILEDRFPGGLEQLAWRIALEGAEETLHGVPVGRFGKLLTVDRQEIEGFRSIRVLIREYAHRPRPERPLSIAVFGPPGSGKSFGVKEVARSVLPGRISDPPLTFNLSQFDDPSALLDALHQVRDESLAGMLPLVFWDEFDTTFEGEPLGWLRYFLSPMQDGEFQEEQITHPIGPAVFVFAGGTSKRMQDFGSSVTDFVEVKGPDFVSRLKGYVNILGPDPRDGHPDDDPYYLVRRAILLRTMLLRDAKHLFREDVAGRLILEIDPGVLRAFLLTRVYRHGARSMESILAMSTLTGKSRFERSSLPAEAQLDLHVDAANFLDLVQRLDLRDEELIERMAEIAHVVFSAAMLEKGSTWAEESDDYLLGHPLLKPFAGHARDLEKSQRTLVSWGRLTDEDREQNRALVRDIPNKLAAAGYAMRPARGGEAADEFSKEVVELLAELEHERWMRARLDVGWSYGAERNDAGRLHPAILTWRKMTPEARVEHYGSEWAKRIGDEALPEDQKDKDRDLIEGIARILAVSGYAVAKVGG